MKSPIVVKDTLYEMRVTHEQLLLIENSLMLQYDFVAGEMKMSDDLQETYTAEYEKLKYILAKINEITKSNRLTTEHKPSNMFYIKETKLPEPFDKYDV